MQVADILAQAQVQAAVVQAMGLVIGLFCVGLGLYCGLSQLARKSDPLSQTSVVFSCLQPRVGEECTCFEANVGHMDACLQRAGNDWSRSNGNGCRGADGGERGDGQQCGDTDICLQSPACRGVVGRADQAGRASLGVHNHLPAVIMCGGFNRQAGHL